MNAAEAIALHGEAAVSQAARHALWRAGDLSWMYHYGVGPAWNGQVKLDALIEDAYARGVRRFVANIGRRWGKSHYFVARATQRCLRKPRTRIPYAASTGVSLMQFIIPIARTIADTAPRDVRPEIVDFEMRFPNESVIVFQGCEDMAKANRLRGPSADEAIVDEAAFIAVLAYVVHSVLSFQLATNDGMMLIGSTPPETPAHPFTGLAAEAQTRGAYMHATIHDSPFVTPDAAEKLCEESGGVRSSAWRREALAQFVVDETRAILPEFSADDADGKPVEAQIVYEIERPEHFDTYTIGDLGFVDLSAILFGYWHFTEAKIVIEDELFLERATSETVQLGVQRIERERWGDKQVLARLLDATLRERSDMEKLQKDHDPTSAARWTGVNNKERDAAVNALRLDIQRRKIVIHPRCTTLIAHLRHGIWNTARTDFERSEGLGHFDGVAALMYFARHVDRRRNPFPDPVYSHQTHFVPPGVNKPKSGWASIGQGPRRQ